MHIVEECFFPNSEHSTREIPFIQNTSFIVNRFSLKVVSWCGTRGSETVLDVAGSVVVVSFTTDTSDTYLGFNISVEFVNESK